jgi:FtsP/CotA-like multicopper oxidase with cupredoxin domain
MHSHQGFQHQKMLSGPLIVRTADEVSADNQEVTIFLEDFLFRDPLDVMSALEKGGAEPMGKKGDAGMPADKMDLNDVDFDAYLANDRTLDDPQVIRVEKGGRVRLRVINGASSTNFQIDLGSLRGTVVAVDGNATQPLAGSRFGLAMAQRIDILVDLPSGAGVWPILAVREGDKRQTGVVLASPGINVRKVAALATTTAGAVDLDQEQLLSAREPLSLRPADLHVLLTLTGSMHPYAWGINHKGWDDRDTVKVSSGQRVWITFQNTTKMSHPMHLHGHHFQVVALNGKTISGAVRDTILVPPMANVTVAFDANNPGNWLLHCHNQYHMEAGMITDVSYV